MKEHHGNELPEQLTKIVEEILQTHRNKQPKNAPLRIEPDRARARRLEVVEHLLKKGDSITEGETVMKIDALLKTLELQSPRAGRALELRYFGGNEFKTIAVKLSCSEDTVRRDIRVARAFITMELNKRQR